MVIGISHFGYHAFNNPVNLAIYSIVDENFPSINILSFEQTEFIKKS